MASEAKAMFTPGPWHRNIKPASKYPIIFAGRNTHVAQVLGPNDEAQEADCNLITAAPDLYMALEQAFFALGALGANADVNHPGRKAWEAARAALAKAGGAA